MLILNKGVKDYYDWYCSVLGVDTSVTYDRRKFYILSADNYTLPYILRNIFSPVPQFDDKPKQAIKNFYNSESIVYRQEHGSKTKSSSLRDIKTHSVKDEYKEGKIYHIILEAGNTHYCFEVERYLDDKDPKLCHIDATLLNTINNVSRRYGGECPLSIIPLSGDSTYHLMHTNWGYTSSALRWVYNNPILANTFIPSFVPAEEIWRKIYDYLSSLKDKPFIDSRTNNEHIESAGFDKKDSFRPKKKS